MKERLIEAIAAAGASLVAASGGRISFDPHVALERDGAPKRTCHLLRAKDGWIAANLARDDDRGAVPAWLESGELDWIGVEARVAELPVGYLLERAVMLHLPVAVVGEVRCEGSAVSGTLSRTSGATATAVPKSVPETAFPSPLHSCLDLSALWAGPYCGGLLAEAGIAVTKFESPNRPDPTPHTSPKLNHRLNSRKHHMQRNLTSLTDLIPQTAILITSARPHALARLGLTEERLFALNPDLIWVAITAYGWSGDAAMRVGFGDDCAAAGGLVEWMDGAPNFIGDALADPLTGMIAATRALQALSSGHAGLIDIALAPTAAHFSAMIA